MFYSHDLLTKRGGSFGLIWLAATASKSKVISLKRRDYLSVNIELTCDAIQLHISKVRRQLSLYLSSQLMYGVVKVYKMQNYYLFSDATSLMTRCTSMLQGTEMIDLKPLPRVSNVLSTPDLGTVDLRLRDSEFGLFKVSDLVSPDEIPDIEQLTMPQRMAFLSTSEEESLGGSGLELSQERIATTPQRMTPVADQPHTVSNDRISIKDTPVLPFSEIQIPGEMDLPPLTEEGVETLLSRSAEEEDPLQGQPKKKKPHSDTERPRRTKDGTDGKPETTDTLPLDIDMQQLGPTEDTPAVLVDPYQMPSPKRKRRQPVLPDVTQLSPVQPPPSKRQRQEVLELDDTIEQRAITPSRRRPRMLQFADAETQIHKSVLRNFMSDTTPILRRMELAAPNLANYTNLFIRPGRPGLGRGPLLQLWRNNCKTTSMGMEEAMQPFDGSSSDEALQLSGEAETPDEVRRSRDEDSGRGERLLQTVQEVSADLEMDRVLLEESAGIGLESMERGRDVSREQSREDFQVTPHTSAVEKSVRRARSGSIASLDKTLSGEQASFRHVGMQESSIGASIHGDMSSLGNILEESREASDMSVSFMNILGPQETEAMTSPRHRNVYKTLKHTTRDAQMTTFRTICPLTMDKKDVAKTFSCMLDFLGKKRIYAVQEEPYAEIMIYSEKL